jgi:large subunit ribosomal protein L21
MYAIIQIGNKQYKVSKDMTIDVDKVKGSVEPKVLMFVDGDKVLVGSPYLSNVKIKTETLEEVQGKKVLGVKFKKRKNYTRTVGHRAHYIRLKIAELSVA